MIFSQISISTLLGVIVCFVSFLFPQEQLHGSIQWTAGNDSFEFTKKFLKQKAGNSFAKSN